MWNWIVVVMVTGAGILATGCSDDVYPNLGGSATSHATSSSARSVSSEVSSSFSAASAGAIVRVAFFNAEDFNSDSVAGTGTWGTVADIVATNSIDIIVLSETEPYDAPRFSQALAARGVSMTWRMTTSNTSDPNEDYLLKDEISVWSRFAITGYYQVARGFYPDPVTGNVVSAPRYVLRTSIAVGGKSLWVYGAHLKAVTGMTNEQRRRAQAHALEEYIKSNHAEENDWILVSGDMNTITPSIEFIDAGTIGYLTMKSDNPGNTANDFTAVNLTHLPLPDGYTWRSSSWPSGFADAILDHVILSPALYARYVPGSVRILMKGVSPRISDHYPIMLDLSLE